MKCSQCCYWGGSDSTGDTRTCFCVGPLIRQEKHKDDTCNWLRDEKECPVCKKNKEKETAQ